MPFDLDLDLIMIMFTYNVCFIVGFFIIKRDSILFGYFK